jgi:uncharacterized membrane protein (DUF4010 family)
VTINEHLTSEGLKILLVLFLSFIIGLEREEHKTGVEHFVFGGVRTFPLIGLIGYSLAVLSGGQLAPVALGFAVVAGFLLLSYWHKLSCSNVAGVTSEMSGLTTYLVGALVYYGHFWIATTLSVANALLLELKVGLEGLTKRIAPDEILTFTKFLLLSAVILPILPNSEFTSFRINPFKTWLVVVAVSGVSYGSYVLLQLTKERGGVVLAALLGGAYSSTVSTVVLARRAAREEQPHLFSGAILMGSGVMYLRVAALVGLFNRNLLAVLAPSFMALAGLGILGGWIWSRRPDARTEEVKREFQPKNPLELGTAFLFGLFFLAMLVATRLAVLYLGRAGVYSLGALMGLTDITPFIMGMTQAAPTQVALPVASAATLIAASSNNVVKGIYAYALADRATGSQSLWALIGLAVLGLTPLLWLFR